MHVFVSYSRHDSDFVARLVAVLEADGHDVWLDATDIRGSDEWRQSIVTAIRAADVVVLVISPRSMASTDVQREITVAAEEQRRILPVVLEHADLTGSIRYELAGVQHISFEGQPFDDASSKLLEALRARRAQTTASRRSAGTAPTKPRMARGAALRGRATGLGVVVVGILILAVVRLALGSGAGPGTLASVRPGQPTGAGSSTGTVGLNAAVWFSGFDIKVDGARYDPARRRVSIDVAFTNRQPINADPVNILVDSITALEWSGRRFAPSCRCNPLPVSATLTTSLTFDVDDGFDLAGAVLVFGGPTQHRASVPLDGQPGTSEMPISHAFSGAIRDGAGTTFKVEKVDVVPAGCNGFPDGLNYVPGRMDLLSIVVWGTAETTVKYGVLVGDTFLILPDGSKIASTSLTPGSLGIYPDQPKHDVGACMSVPAPATGTYRFVVTANDVKPKPKGFTFKL